MHRFFLWRVAAVAALLMAGCSGSDEGGSAVTLVPASTEVLATSVAESGMRPPATEPFGLSAAYDESAAVVVAVADGGTWTFDVATDQWSPRDAVAPVNPQGGLVYSPEAGAVLVPAEQGELYEYDVDGDTWTLLPGDPVPARAGIRLLGVDEGSGELLAFDFANMLTVWRYDLVSGTWTEVEQRGGFDSGDSSGGPLMAYDPGAGGFVVLDYGADVTSGNSAWLFDPRAGTWTAIAGVGPMSFGYFPTGSEATYAAAPGRVVVFSDGVTAEYDAASDEWAMYPVNTEAVGVAREGPLYRHGASLVYDPTKARVLMFGGVYLMEDDWVKADDMWVYDPTSHTWSLLLAATQTVGGSGSTPSEMCAEGSFPSVAAYDIDTGEFRWAACEESVGMFVAEAASGDTVWVVRVDYPNDTAIAYDAATGEERGRGQEAGYPRDVPDDADRHLSSPLAMDGVRLTGGQDDPLNGYSAESGDLLWTQVGYTAYDDVWAVGDGAVFASKWDATGSWTVGYDVATGDLRWQREVGGSTGLPWHVAGERLYLLWYNVQVLSTNDGSTVWETEFAPPEDGFPRMFGVVANDDTVFVSFTSIASGGD